MVDADDEVVAAGEVVSGRLLGGTLVADLERPLPAGDYRVAWRNVSLVDGDPGRGRYGFTVGGADAVAAPGCGHVTDEEAALAAGEEGGGAPLAAIVGVGGAVVAAVLGFAVLRRRSSAAA